MRKENKGNIFEKGTIYFQSFPQIVVKWVTHRWMYVSLSPISVDNIQELI